MPLQPENSANCMTIVIGRKASATGRVILGHNEDDGGRFVVRHGYVPPRDHAPSERLPCEEGRASIPQAPHTFGFYWAEVVGPKRGVSNSDLMLNDNGVCVVSDSSCGSREDRPDAELLREGGIEYNVRRIAAERARSAREGAELVCSLAETWGYAPGGRLYILADERDAFVVQLMRGRRYLMARVPDDAVAAIPNHYVVRSRRDAEEVVFSPGLAAYAVERGWATSEEAFDFYEAFQSRDHMNDPVNTLRQDYALRLLTGKTFDRARLPFAAAASRLLTVSDMIDALSCHYEGTPDDVRIGPGASPHNTGITRVCRGSTIESTIIEFAENAKDITAWTAFGRPCQQLFLPLHPLCGTVDAVDRMDDPAAALENHLSPSNRDVSWQRNGWQAFRDFGNTAEFFHAECEDALRAFRVRWHESFSRANRERSGRAPLFDAAAVADAQAAMARFADEHFRRVAVSVQRSGGRYAVSFNCPGTPLEDSLLFGMGCLNLRTQYAHAEPGSLAKTGDGRYTAAFDEAGVFCAGTGAGIFECFLGGTTENGESFAGMALIERAL